MSRIIESANGLFPELSGLRRQIHKNPELGFCETNTAGLVAGKLRELNLEVAEKVGRTGVVGLLKGNRPGKTVALRADMDALPIQEQKETEYASCNKGVMHACGHDAHTAMLLGAAMLLASMREQIAGQVKFIFQPCEEEPPGGAIEMIRAGVLEKPKVDAIFGLHVEPMYPAGFIGYKEGTMMAAVDNFRLDIIGKGGHGASPHMGTDAIVTAAEVISALQTIPSRKINPLEPVVISIGTIEGGRKDNIIADRVAMSGTVRTLNPGLREQIPVMMENIIGSVTKAHNATYSLHYEHSYPPLVNDSGMVELIREVAREIAGKDRVMPVAAPTMGGEDFAYYTQMVPGAFVNLGVGFRNRENYSLHHPCFDIDEQALPVGTALLAGTALKYLERYNKSETI